MTVDVLQVGPLGANCYILADEKTRQAFIIDPGGEGSRILAFVRKKGLAVVGILNTHGHFDHAGANAEVVKATRAPLAAPRGDATLLAFLPKEAAVFGFSVPPSPAPSRLLQDGDTLTLGGSVIKVLGAPGHTPGGICFLTPAGLFSGDLLFAGSVGRTDLPGGDWNLLVHSIREKVLSLPDSTPVYPGHGPSTTVGRERRANPFLQP